MGVQVEDVIRGLNPPPQAIDIIVINTFYTRALNTAQLHNTRALNTTVAHYIHVYEHNTHVLNTISHKARRTQMYLTDNTCMGRLQKLELEDEVSYLGDGFCSACTSDTDYC